MPKNRKLAVEFLNKALVENAGIPPEDLIFSYKGVLYPAAVCNPGTFQALESFEARMDDIVLAGYPKTGTNWLDHILNNLESTAAKYTEEEMKKIMDLEKELEVTPRLEFGDPDKFQRMKKLPSRRIIITHLSPHSLPSSIFKNKAKILVLIRNPKDTLVSYYHFKNTVGFFLPSTWDDHFNSFMDGKVAWGSYFDYVAEWDKYIDEENIIAISYEELQENLNVGVKKIAQFLEFSLNEEEVQSIVDKSTFRAMKQKASETHGAFGNILFRKGTVGDWKSMLSESQNEEMDRKFEECLSRTKLGAKIKYDLYCKV
ncbi:UNVERIFIED_CONTAM: hypothetical protein K2H54_060197 [Gekko kuhli]